MRAVIHCLTLAILCAFSLAACKGAGQSGPEPEIQQQASLDEHSLPFPDFAMQPTDQARQSSVLNTLKQLGKDWFRRSPTASTNADFIDLQPSADELAWVIYAFSGMTDQDEALSLSATFSTLPGEYHLGIADFATGRWHIIKRPEPGSPSAVDTVQIPAGLEAITANGILFAAVILSSPASATLEQLELEIDSEPAAPLAAFSASSIRGNVTLMVDFDAGNSVDLDGMGSIANYEWDFDGDGSYDMNGSTPMAQHSYTEPGIYFCKLRVTDDNDGLTDTAIREIRVLGWHVGFGTEGGDFSQAYVSAEDNIYGVGSISVAATASNHCNWYKLDGMGNLLWFRTWQGDLGSSIFYEVETLPDGGLIAAGILIDTDTNDIAAIVARISTSGDLLWLKRWNTGDTDVFSSVTVVDADNIYVSGTTSGFRADNEEDALFIKLNDKGQLLWQKRLTNTETCNPTGSKASGGKLIFSMWADSYSNSRDMGILQIDEDGTVLDEDIFDLAESIHCNDLTVDRFGNIYTSGYCKTTPTQTWSFAAKFSSTGSNDWFTTVQHGEETRSGEIFLRYPSLVANPSVILSCNVEDNSSYFPLLAQFDSMGVLEKAHSFFTSENLTLLNVGAGPYGGMYMGGYSEAKDLSYTQTAAATSSPAISPIAGTSTMFDVNATFDDPVGTVVTPQVTVGQQQDGNDFIVACYYVDDL